MTTQFRDEYNADLARVFSAASLRQICSGETAELRRMLHGAMERPEAMIGMSWAELVQAVHDHLSRSYRSEYIYKNAIARKILLGRHSLNTTRFFTEFPVGECKADVVLVNGTTTAYEIKTELDQMQRLPKQIATYCSAFDRVFVVTHESILEQVMALCPSSVGIIGLMKRCTLRVIRDADSNAAQVDPAIIFDCLRRGEYLAVLQNHFGDIPAMPNSRVYQECRRLFLSLTSEQAHEGLLEQLRLRRVPESLRGLVETGPGALSAALLGSGLKVSDLEALKQQLGAPVEYACP